MWVSYPGIFFSISVLLEVPCPSLLAVYVILQTSIKIILKDFYTTISSCVVKKRSEEAKLSQQSPMLYCLFMEFPIELSNHIQYSKRYFFHFYQ